MKTKNYLVFDFGASNGRALIGKYNGNKIGFEEVYRFDNRPVRAGGTLYWDILRLYLELLKGIELGFKKTRHITSLGIDTWGVDFGFIDERGKLISNPIHYRDEARNSCAEEVYKKISKRKLFELSGIFILPILSVFNLYSLKKQNAPEYLCGKRLLMIPDIFNFFLTGEMINEYTNATTTAMFDQIKKRWSDEILSILEFKKEIFSDITLPGRIIGSLKKEIQSELGIQPIKVILTATHDTASAEAAVPASKSNGNWAFISAGTWCVSGMETKEPVLSNEVFYSDFGNEGDVNGKTFLAANINGLWIIQNCRDRWIKEYGKSLSWDEIVEMAIIGEPFTGWIDVDEAVFVNPATDMPKIVFENIKPSKKISMDNVTIARCVYESLVMKFKKRLDDLERITGEKIKVLHIVGGGSRNRLLCQWTSNVAGIPVVAGPNETTAVGNLLMQLKGTGEINSIYEGREIARNSFDIKIYEPVDVEKWKEAYEKYKSIFYKT